MFARSDSGHTLLYALQNQLGISVQNQTYKEKPDRTTLK